MASRKELVEAAKDLNDVVIDPTEAIDVSASAAKVEAKVRDAAKIVRDDDNLKPETRRVLSELTGQDFGAPTAAEEAAIAETPAEPPEDEDEDDEDDEDQEADEPVAAEATPKVSGKNKANGEAKPAKEKRTRAQSPLGKFEPVRRGSVYAKLLEAALAGPTPLADAATAAGTDRDKAINALKRARIVNGVDYSLDYDVLTVMLPKGVDAESVWYKAKEKPAKAAGNGTKQRYGEDAVIKLLVKDNPKQKGSAAHGRFALYRDGMTVKSFLDAGGSRGDLSWDRGHGFIQVGA